MAGIFQKLLLLTKTTIFSLYFKQKYLKELKLK